MNDTTDDTEVSLGSLTLDELMESPDFCVHCILMYIAETISNNPEMFKPDAVVYYYAGIAQALASTTCDIGGIAEQPKLKAMFDGFYEQCLANKIEAMEIDAYPHLKFTN